MGYHEEDKDTSFANRDGIMVHISEVPKGRGGYTCRGCGEELVAIQRHVPRKFFYFRHYATDQTPRKKCSYSDYQERIKIATDHLRVTKTIRVPPVYKFPPDGSEGEPFLVSRAQTVQAHKIQLTTFFYIDKVNNIHFGEQRDTPELKFLLKADLVFLDEKDEIILLIVFAKKQLMSADLKERINLLRIDTLQITIPRETEDAIRKSFDRTEHTKWLYNDDHATTEYRRVSTGDTEGVHDVDELQRGFFEENFYCRRSQITRLIRKITNYLESERYKQITTELSTELGGVETERIRIEQQRRELQERAKEEIRAEYRSTENELRSRRTNTLRAIEQIIAEQRDIEAELNSELISDGAFRNAVNARKREITNRIAEIGSDINTNARRIEEIRRDQEAAPRKFREEEDQLDIEHRQSTKRIVDRDGKGGSELSRQIKDILGIRGTIDNYAALYPTYVRYQKAWRSIRNGDYKNWINERTIH